MPHPLQSHLGAVCAEGCAVCAPVCTARAHARWPGKVATDKDPLHFGHWVASGVPICIGAESPIHCSHTWELFVLRAVQYVHWYVLCRHMRDGQARLRPTKIPYTLATRCLLVCQYVSGLSPLSTAVTSGSCVWGGLCSMCAGMYCTGACKMARQGRDRQRSPTLWPPGAFWCANICRA